MQLPGPHLAGDLLAAAVAARALGAAPSAIAQAVASFRGAEHVLEYVATVDGVALLQRLQGHEHPRGAQGAWKRSALRSS